jgi:hypothetical protein
MNPAYLDLGPHGTEKEKHRGTLRRMGLTLVSPEALRFRSTGIYSAHMPTKLHRNNHC